MEAPFVFVAAISDPDLKLLALAECRAAQHFAASS
jgi:hypothetical protein